MWTEAEKSNNPEIQLYEYCIDYNNAANSRVSLKNEFMGFVNEENNRLPENFQNKTFKDLKTPFKTFRKGFHSIQHAMMNSKAFQEIRDLCKKHQQTPNGYVPKNSTTPNTSNQFIEIKNKVKIWDFFKGIFSGVKEFLSTGWEILSKGGS